MKNATPTELEECLLDAINNLSRAHRFEQYLGIDSDDDEPCPDVFELTVNQSPVSSPERPAVPETPLVNTPPGASEPLLTAGLGWMYFCIFGVVAVALGAVGARVSAPPVTAPRVVLLVARLVTALLPIGGIARRVPRPPLSGIVGGIVSGAVQPRHPAVGLTLLLRIVVASSLTPPPVAVVRLQLVVPSTAIAEPLRVVAEAVAAARRVAVAPRSVPAALPQTPSRRRRDKLLLPRRVHRRHARRHLPRPLHPAAVRRSGDRPRTQVPPSPASSSVASMTVLFLIDCLCVVLFPAARNVPSFPPDVCPRIPEKTGRTGIDSPHGTRHGRARAAADGRAAGPLVLDLGRAARRPGAEGDARHAAPAVSLPAGRRPPGPRLPARARPTRSLPSSSSPSPA